MTSETRTAYGSAVSRQGSGRAAAAYQSSSAATSTGRTVATGQDGARDSGAARSRGRPVARTAGGPAAASGPGRGGVQLAPQVPDLVAQLGRVLEAQVLGRRQHLLLELHDRGLELLRG